MTIIEMRQLRNLLRNYSSAAYKHIDTWAGGNVILHFHQWANNCTSKGAFLFENQNGLAYWLLLIEWKNDNWYLVIYPESRQRALVEIKELEYTQDGKTMVWSYKPMKRDGKNPERKRLFANDFPDNKVRIPIT